MEAFRTMSEIATEIALESGVEVEYFVPIPRPPVKLFGSAENDRGYPLAKIVEICASKVHYLVVVELPRVLYCDREGDWVVDANGEIMIEGKITPSAIYANKLCTANKNKRVKLCPTEPWAISFYLPGPVDWWTTEVLFTSENVMEITVTKSRPVAEMAVVDSSAVDVSLTGPEVIEMVDGWLV